jgi:hypothetical protein
LLECRFFEWEHNMSKYTVTLTIDSQKMFDILQDLSKENENKIVTNGLGARLAELALCPDNVSLLCQSYLLVFGISIENVAVKEEETK